MTALPATSPEVTRPSWVWPLDPSRYNRQPSLTKLERAALHQLGIDNLRGRHGYDREAPEWHTISRLRRPLEDAQTALWCPDSRYYRRAIADAVALVLMRCADDDSAYWGWSNRDWARLIGQNAAEFEGPWPGWLGNAARSYVVSLAYLLTGFTAFEELGRIDKVPLAWRVFGPDAVNRAVEQVSEVLGTWGYRCGGDAPDKRLPGMVCHALLFNRSPHLEDLSAEAFSRLRQQPALTEWQNAMLHPVQRAVAALGYCDPPSPSAQRVMPAIAGTSPQWAAWVERWHATSTLTPEVRCTFRGVMAKAGRWLADQHPEISEPTQWTRQTCAAWVAAVDRMNVGDYIQREHESKDAGKPLSPRTKVGYLTATRTVFRDLQEWEWLPRRFDPTRALATPRSVRALVGPNPRVIADDIWAKLLWAGLNVESEDLPESGPYYPIELIRAITVTWLFAGQRSDEIARLRVGCVRWQHDNVPIPGDSNEVLARDAVCLLDIPAHKTGTAFTKPVDPLLGKAIEAWQAVRPVPPAMLDRKTGERVDFLFALRARRVGKDYINNRIIPALCAKADVPTNDVRGNITSHRARSTIATQLYNAKEPMTLFELQAWLGHSSPSATQHYAKITPNTLARAYNDAGYFARNVRAIEVLVDRDAVASGAAAAGEPWQYYDLGHGYCAYTFFEQCPHRMACARCDFYTPKDSSKAGLLEAKTNLQQMLANIPLSDDEQAAIDDGQAALDHLLERLADTPTPAGATPREIGLPATATLLPISPVTRGNP